MGKLFRLFFFLSMWGFSSVAFSVDCIGSAVAQYDTDGTFTAYRITSLVACPSNIGPTGATGPAGPVGPTGPAGPPGELVSEPFDYNLAVGFFSLGMTIVGAIYLFAYGIGQVVGMIRHAK